MRKKKVDELVDKITKLGHSVRLDENSDTPTVKRNQKAFKEALKGATEEEKLAAWAKTGSSGKRAWTKRQGK